METKHSEGPWSVSLYTNVGDERQIWSDKVVNGDQKHIANVFTNHTWEEKLRFCKIDREEQIANAKLIAASPDLLNACNFALQGIKNGQADELTVKILEDAISKAVS
jgi:hypothetical protein